MIKRGRRLRMPTVTMPMAALLLATACGPAQVAAAGATRFGAGVCCREEKSTLTSGDDEVTPLLQWGKHARFQNVSNRKFLNHLMSRLMRQRMVGIHGVHNTLRADQNELHQFEIYIPPVCL